MVSLIKFEIKYLQMSCNLEKIRHCIYCFECTLQGFLAIKTCNFIGRLMALSSLFSRPKKYSSNLYRQRTDIRLWYDGSIYLSIMLNLVNNCYLIASRLHGKNWSISFDSLLKFVLKLMPGSIQLSFEKKNNLILKNIQFISKTID